MKKFESFLAPKMKEFLTHRQSLGYTQGNRTYLLSLDRYLQEKNADWQALKPDFFLEYRSRFKEPITANRHISAVRVFFQFLVRQEI